MAKKTKPRSPIPEPPSDSSDEEQIRSSQHHHDQEEDEDEASSQEEHQPVPPSNNSHPKPTSSESDSGSESDPPPPPPKSKLKPLPPKPTDHTPNPNSKPHPSKKRTAKNNDTVNDSKRSKKKKGTDAAAAAAASAVAAVSSSDDEDAAAKKTGGDSRKLFQRLWSEEDEIAILKGMVEFTSKTGSDPYKYAEAFHNFMKKSLHVQASSNQLKQKIRRLKKKFETNANKGSFLKPHDQQAFELSKKVWGNAEGGGGVEKAELDEKAAKIPTKEGRKTMKVAPPKQKPELQHELRSMDHSKKAVKMNVDEKSDTPYVGFGLYGLNGDMVKRGMELIGASERAELEEEWKELQHAELELYVKRAELVANQTRLILEAYKSSNH